MIYDSSRPLTLATISLAARVGIAGSNVEHKLVDLIDISSKERH
jgi:hypothetical protein